MGKAYQNARVEKSVFVVAIEIEREIEIHIRGKRVRCLFAVAAEDVEGEG